MAPSNIEGLQMLNIAIGNTKLRSAGAKQHCATCNPPYAPKTIPLHMQSQNSTLYCLCWPICPPLSDAEAPNGRPLMPIQWYE